MNLPCILCDMADWFGWMHDRANWRVPYWREAMGRAHGLVLAPGGTLRDGPWVQWRDPARDDGEYE